MLGPNFPINSTYSYKDLSILMINSADVQLKLNDGTKYEEILESYDHELHKIHTSINNK